MRTTLFAILVILQFVCLPLQAQRRRGGEESSDRDRRNIEYLLAEAEKFFITEDYAKALNGFLEILKEDQHNPVANYKVAQIYLLEEEYDKALLYAQAAKEYMPDNKYYYLQLAETHSRLANYKEASTIYEEMLERIPGTDEHLYELAALYLFQRDLEKALDTYDRIEESFGKQQEVSYQKQKILISQNKVEDAIEEGEELIDAFPENSDYVYALVDLLINQGDNDRAIGYLRELQAQQPDDRKVNLLMADLYRREARYTEGVKHLEHAIADPGLDLDAKLRLLTGYILQLPNEELAISLRDLCKILVETHPEDSEANGIYGDLLFQTGDKPGAREQYLISVEKDPSNFELWQNIVAIDWEREEYDQVITHTDKALEFFPNQALLYYYNGHAHYLSKSYEDATFSLEQGKRLAFRNPELQGVFHGLLGDAYNALKQYNKSDRAYEDALKLDPGNAFVLNNYSYFLSLRRENLNRALELSGRLVELHPDNRTYLDTYGWVLYQLGEYPKAADMLKRAINQGDPSGTILEHYGDILFRLNRVDEALQQWEKARDAGGHSELLEQKIADRQLYENQ